MSTKTTEQTAISGDVVLNGDGYTDHVQQSTDGEAMIKEYLALNGKIADINHNLQTARSHKIRGMMEKRSGYQMQLSDIVATMSPDVKSEAEGRLAQKNAAKRAKLRNRAESTWQTLHDASLSAALTAATASKVAIETQKCISEAIRIAQSRNEDYWEALPVELRHNSKLRYMQVFVDGIAAIYENEIAIASGRTDADGRTVYKVAPRYNVVVNDPAEGFYWVSSLANAKLQDVRLFLAAEQLVTAEPDIESGVITVGKEYLRTKVA